MANPIPETQKNTPVVPPSTGEANQFGVKDEGQDTNIPNNTATEIAAENYEAETGDVSGQEELLQDPNLKEAPQPTAQSSGEHDTAPDLDPHVQEAGIERTLTDSAHDLDKAAKEIGGAVVGSVTSAQDITGDHITLPDDSSATNSTQGGKIFPSPFATSGLAKGSGEAANDVVESRITKLKYALTGKLGKLIAGSKAPADNIQENKKAA